MNIRRLTVFMSFFLSIAPDAFAGSSQVAAEKEPVELARARRKPKIIYRTIENTKAYEKPTSGQHVTIKVTPPTKKGPNEFVYVEIYNWTKTNLSLVEFDITLMNNSGYDLSTHIVGDAMLAGYSGVKKIPVPGSGPFVPITKVAINALQIVNEDATFVIVPTYVDLVRVVPGSKPASAAPAKKR